MSASADDSGNNGGSDSTDLKSLLVFGIAYGLGTTIAVKAISRFASGRKKDERKIPTYCEFVMDFYKNCIRNYSECDAYREIIKRCHESGVTSGDGATVSHPPLDPQLLLLSYRACRENHFWPWGPCKKYRAYMEKANVVLQ